MRGQTNRALNRGHGMTNPMRQTPQAARVIKLNERHAPMGQDPRAFLPADWSRLLANSRCRCRGGAECARSTQPHNYRCRGGRAIEDERPRSIASMTVCRAARGCTHVVMVAEPWPISRTRRPGTCWRMTSPASRSTSWSMRAKGKGD